ncbi:zinc finger protein OZF-like [Anopheles cruzii]|uniref:zinc finger protein OZF-like n=1 Tax=Anopheles cruzii TaxID=68878 RepID=UPI0022EC57FE|nr:zinc finger protein OZF-like [Anopheles cruzii]
MPELSWLPTNACGNCAGTIDNFIGFRQKVRTNQDYLYSLKVEEGPNGAVSLSQDVKAALSENIDQLPSTSIPTHCLEVTYDSVKELEGGNNSTAGVASVNDEVVVKKELSSDEDIVCNSPTIQSDNEDSSDPLSERKKKAKRGRPRSRRSSSPLVAADKQRRRKATQEDEQRLKDFYHLACEVCETVSESFSDLLAHYRTEHNTGGFVRCCDRTFKKKYLALEHLGGHMGTIRCDICSKTYYSGNSLKLHKLERHSGPEAKPFKCDKCHQSFPKPYLLKSHQQRHKQEPCPTCGKMLGNRSALKVHIATMHGNVPNLICDICGKEIGTKQTMERHMNMHMGRDTVERVQCGQCQKWFKGNYVLKKHIQHMHIEQGQTFQCDICQQSYPNSRSLATHKQSTHGEEKHECEICGKRFKKKDSLRDHFAVHTDKRPYACEFCDLTFKFHSSKYFHRKTAHPAELAALKQAKKDKELPESKPH